MTSHFPASSLNCCCFSKLIMYLEMQSFNISQISIRMPRGFECHDNCVYIVKTDCNMKNFGILLLQIGILNYIEDVVYALDLFTDLINSKKKIL